MGYGVGDLGLNIYWHSLSLILVFWYAEVVGLEPKVAGLIYAAGLFWDAISDPLVASFAAANRSRWGSYRPFILFGSFALGASFCLLFWKPPFEGVALLIALLGSGILFRTCYTIVAVPYSALSARITYDSNERAELSGVRMFFAFCGMLCVSSFFFPLSRLIGGDENSAEGFLLTAGLGAIVATSALLVCFFSTQEKSAVGKVSEKTNFSLRTFVDSFVRNDALRFLMLLLIINSAAGACLFIPMAFYLEANGQSFANKEVVLTGFALSSLAGTPFWTVVARMLGKKVCWSIAGGMMLLSGGALLVFGPIMIEGIPVQILAYGFANPAFAVVIWALIPDTVEYGQYTYGRRDEGPVFGASMLAQKSASALTGLGVGYVLSGIGYDPALAIQTEYTAARLEQFLAIAPPLLILVAGFVIWLLPLSRNVHARIVDELGI
ncbi:MAG: glycoside-pentoside-hexuronide (GPH):cation symporter [Erythrobacter sp.]|uniref:MFS transporter n=1 Tax=Erythrobacter sp. TaxID=1042 RepID=UPI00326436FE